MKKIWDQLVRRPIALVSAFVLVLLYLGMTFCEFLAPYDPNHLFQNSPNVPPNLSWYSPELGFGPQVQTLSLINGVTQEYVRVRGEYTPVKILTTGDFVRLWGAIPMSIHLFGTDFGRDLEAKAQPVFLFGTDNLGRDVLSRVLYGSRISLTIGFVGVFLSLFLALLFGGLAGYFGGVWDWLIMRLCEFIILIPGLYLILFLRSLLSDHMDSGQSYMLITVILSFVGWPSTARMIRGMVHAYKRQDFVANARLESMPTFSILFRHIVPQMSSILILSVTLGVPGFILGETVLSYLGLGIIDPAVSWGSMINRDATSVSSMVHFPWLFAPGFFLLAVTLAFNFLGEWLRDLADPNWKPAVRRPALGKR